jgi:transposase
MMPLESIVTSLSLSEIDDLAQKPRRSKLEPHRELIRELCRKGRTYREVAQLFRDRSEFDRTRQVFLP